MQLPICINAVPCRSIQHHGPDVIRVARVPQPKLSNKPPKPELGLPWEVPTHVPPQKWLWVSVLPVVVMAKQTLELLVQWTVPTFQRFMPLPFVCLVHNIALFKHLPFLPPPNQHRRVLKWTLLRLRRTCYYH